MPCASENASLNRAADSSASSQLTIQPSRNEAFPQAVNPPSTPGRQVQTTDVRFENMSAGEDAQQVVVSTVQKSLYGKGIVVEARGNQILGQTEDPSIQALSHDRVAVLVAQEESKEPRDTKNIVPAYGPGHRLRRIATKTNHPAPITASSIDPSLTFSFVL